MRAFLRNTFSCALAVLALGLIGCQKKCQQPPEKPFESLTAASWRLVETSDPDTAFQTLNRSNFLIYSFGQDFRGDVKKVENNTQFDAPILTFEYNPAVDDGIIRIQFTVTASGGGTGTGSSASGTTQTTDFIYELGRELLLIDSARGYEYRFVDFRGIVPPDSTCTF